MLIARVRVSEDILWISLSHALTASASQKREKKKKVKRLFSMRVAFVFIPRSL